LTAKNVDTDNPCLRALRLDRSFPAAVLGPVLRLALARLALIWRSDATTTSYFRPPNLARIGLFRKIAAKKSNEVAAKKTGFLFRMERY
jgi:hypothetical protein